MKLKDIFGKTARRQAAAQKEAAMKQRTVADTYTELCRLCSYGEAPQNLTDAQRTFYTVQSYKAEVTSGGHSRYFASSAADLAGELPAALRAVGAHSTAARFEALLRALPLPNSAQICTRIPAMSSSAGR